MTFDEHSQWFAAGHEGFKHDLSGYSTSSPIRQHPFYREVVARGACMTPTLGLMVAGGAHPWMSALRTILGAGPLFVPEERGVMPLVTAGWWRWLRAEGHLRGLRLGAFDLDAPYTGAPVTDLPSLIYNGRWFVEDDHQDIPPEHPALSLLTAEAHLRAYVRRQAWAYTGYGGGTWSLALPFEYRLSCVTEAMARGGFRHTPPVLWEGVEYGLPEGVGIIERTAPWGSLYRRHLLYPERICIFVPPARTAYDHLNGGAP
jgi:hypothetical protein